MNKFILLIIVLICVKISECTNVNNYDLQWCQIKNQNNQKKYTIKCFDRNKKKECKQEIFSIEEKKIVFNNKIVKEDVEIDCEKDHEFIMIFNDDISERKESNSTLKGFDKVSNCDKHECSDYCHQCNSGYRLYGYKEGKQPNGNNVYVSGKFLGGRKTDDLGSSSFNSPTEFLESSFNSKGEDASVNGYDYSDAYIIPTTLKQDEIIKETFTNISKNEEYHLLENNCATVVQRAMNAAGLKVTNKQIFYFPKHSYLAPNVMMKLSRNPFPSATFKEIMRRNPNGIHIRKNN